MRLPRALATAAAAIALAASAAPARGAVSLLQVGTFRYPVGIAAPPGDASRLFVVERAGRVQVLVNGVQRTFLDLTSRVRSSFYEQGLYSIAFAADYAASGRFFVYYTAPPAVGTEGSDLVIAEGRASGDHADPAGLRTILRIPHRTDDGENGGALQVGPDGMLWIGVGDGTAEDEVGNAQRLDPSGNDDGAGRNALLGKILRIDPNPGTGCGGQCTIPAGNPGFAQPEVWAYGLRNPWRFSFDRQTGDLVLTDVGQSSWEEIDFAPAPGRGVGANYGWNALEGNHPFAGGGPLQPAGVTSVAPALELSHAAPQSFGAITGGYVVRDPALPDLFGRYLYADFEQGEIRAVTLRPGAADADADTGIRIGGLLTTFGEDACGRVYVAAVDGPVYRLAQSGACSLAPGVSAPVTASGAFGLTIRASAVQHAIRTGSVLVTARCTRICSLTGRSAFVVARRRTTRARAAAARSSAAKLLTTGTVRARLAEGARVILRLRLSTRTRRSLRLSLRRHRTVTARITVTAADGAGHSVTRVARSRIPLR